MTCWSCADRKGEFELQIIKRIRLIFRVGGGADRILDCLGN